MPVPSDINSRIALAKGWTRIFSRSRICELTNSCANEPSPQCEGCDYAWEEWTDSIGQPRDLPDFVGTLEGLAGLMRELNENAYPDCWEWGYCPPDDEEEQYAHYYIELREPWEHCLADFESLPDQPGHCVGEAWLSMENEEGGAGG